jgi:hypothetical protein
MSKREVDDRFKKFGTVSFTSISKVNDFIGYLENGQVMATRCKKCNSVFFPPRADCYNCLSSDMEWFEVTGEGKLISYSTLKYGPTGFENDLPYTIALAQFKDVKVFGRMSKEIPDSNIKVGISVKISPLKLSNEKVSYEFKNA